MTASNAYRLRFKNQIILEFQKIGIQKEKLEIILSIFANNNCLNARGHYLIRKTRDIATYPKSHKEESK